MNFCWKAMRAMVVVFKYFVSCCAFLASSIDVLCSFRRRFSHVFNKVSTVVCTPSFRSVFLATLGSYSVWDTTRWQIPPIKNRQKIISSNYMYVSLPTLFIFKILFLINGNILLIVYNSLFAIVIRPDTHDHIHVLLTNHW